MSVLAGIVALDGTPLDRQAVDHLCRANTSSRTGRADAHCVAHAAIVQRATLGHVRPFIVVDGQNLFAALARLDNREELASALGAVTGELARTPDAVLLQRMYERWGDAGVARCLGAFAFAAWDGERRQLTLGRDCFGNRALFFHRGRRFVAFATALGPLLALPDVPHEIDEIVLANFMVINNYERRRTFYRGIERVPSRTMMTFDRDVIRDREYWAPDLTASPPYSREEDYVTRARELLDVAVASATRDLRRVAISTSGGLDSSAIAATAARLGMAESIDCFSLVPPVDVRVDVGPYRYLDERDKVEALRRMYPALNVRFIETGRHHPLADEDIRHFVRAHMPAHNPLRFDAANYFVETVTGAGHRTVLEGMSGNIGLSWDGSGSLLALLQAGRRAELGRESLAIARNRGRSIAHTLTVDLFLPAAPVWLRRQIHRLRGRNPYDVAHFSALNPAFITERGLVRQWRALGFEPWSSPPGGRHVVQWRAHRMFDHGQQARYRSVQSDEVLGIESRDPLADRRLLEFVLTVPEPMYRRNGIPRSFARRVLADRLPPQILEEHRRGANTPTWFRSLDRRRKDMAQDIELIEGSPLAQRLIDLPRLKQLLAQWPKDEQEAEDRRGEYRFALASGVHIGRFVRWVEGGNA